MRFRSPLRRLGPALGLAAAIFQGCLGDTTGPTRTWDGIVAAEKWRRSEPDLYSYTVSYLGFWSGGPVHVVANRDSVLSAEADTAGLGGSAVITDKQKYSIDSLMTEVAAQSASRHDSENIHYHQTYGFPESAYIDWKDRELDGGFGLIISDFAPITLVPLAAP
ncbi:MAG: DUF6174 domain-containing protein [Fibrobacteria bacterium]